MEMINNFQPEYPDIGGSSSGEETISRNEEEESDTGSTASELSPSLKHASHENHHHAFGIDDILILRKITRLFDNGIECRQVLDAIINRCSAMQNIREAVLQYQKLINHQHLEPRVRRVALSRGAEYLERYVKLIAFSAYLGSDAFDGFCGQGEARMSFKTWLHQRPEIQAIKWSIRLRPGRFFTLPVISLSLSLSKEKKRNLAVTAKDLSLSLAPSFFIENLAEVAKGNINQNKNSLTFFSCDEQKEQNN
jgi:hypothetical protein